MLSYPKDSPFIMLGDDIQLDILPVQKMGSKTILILTGKTKPPLPSSIAPDFMCEDLYQVIEVLKALYSSA
jgi:ribonucleotide monophosphatase NagD (HAD superfamily)